MFGLDVWNLPNKPNRTSRVHSVALDFILFFSYSSPSAFLFLFTARFTTLFEDTMWSYFSAIQPSTLMTLGLVILVATMIYRAKKYHSKNAAQRRKQAEKGLPQVVSERVPKYALPRTTVQTATSVTPTFTGEHTPSNIAQWEIRIHEIGRQTVAQINTKLAAMQVMLNEIKRANERAESLVSELERFSYENQTVAAQLQNVSNNAAQTTEQVTENVKQPVEQPPENVVTETPAPIQPVVSELESIADESIELNSFRSVLDELTQEQSQWRAEMENLRETLPIPTPPPIPVSSVPTPDEKQTYQETVSRASVLRPYAADSNATTPRHELPPLPDISPLTLPPTTEHPQFESLFVSTSPRQVPGNKISPETRQDIFLLSDYGYTAKEIANKVNVSIDEVQRTIKLRTSG